MAEKSVTKPNDILQEFHEILQRCCKLEDTLIKNVGMLNCIKNNDANSCKDLENIEMKMQDMRQKTDALESEQNKLTAKDLQKGTDLEDLKKRCAKSADICEKSKENFRQLMQEIEQDECKTCG
jgi:DNA repair ATPase RecN